MPLLERYVLRLLTVSFAVGLVGLTGVIWITQALRDVDLLTTKGQSLLIFLMATGLVVPSLLLVIAPVALLGAILFILNKLNADSELAVMSAVGMSPLRMVRPFAVLTLAVAILVGALSLWIMPSSFGTLRTLIMQVRSDFLSRIVREGQFTTLDRGVVFHYRERGPGGALLGLFIQDRRDPEQINTYIAESGRTVENDKQNFLILEKGSVQRQTRNGRDPIMVIFERYAIDLAQLGSEGEGAPLKPRERSTAALLHPDLNDPYVARNIGSFRSELHERFVNPLYSLAFGLIGFAALAQARTTRQGRGLAILAAIVAAAAVRVTGFGIAALAARQSWAIVLLYGVPLGATAIAAWYAFGNPAGFSARSRQARRAAPVSS